MRAFFEDPTYKAGTLWVLALALLMIAGTLSSCSTTGSDLEHPVVRQAMALQNGKEPTK